MKIYLISFAQKRWAHQCVQRALRRGVLAAHSRCQICCYDELMLLQHQDEEADRFAGPTKYISSMLVAHHFHYDKPLSVWWLCRKCHAMLHDIQRKARIAFISLDAAKRAVLEYMAKNSDNVKYATSRIARINQRLSGLRRKVIALENERSFWKAQLR